MQQFLYLSCLKCRWNVIEIKAEVSRKWYITLINAIIFVLYGIEVVDQHQFGRRGQLEIQMEVMRGYKDGG